MGSMAVRQSGIAHSAPEEYADRGQLRPAKGKAHEDKATLREDCGEQREGNTPHTAHPDSGSAYIQRPPIGRQKSVGDATCDEGRMIKQEKEQRQSNPRGMR